MYIYIVDDAVGPTAATVAGSIPARKEIFIWPTGRCPGLAICVCDFSMFATEPTIYELLLVCRHVFFLYKKKNIVKLR